MIMTRRCEPPYGSTERALKDSEYVAGLGIQGENHHTALQREH